MSILNRRNLLQGALAGAGLIGLRAMATGLPISFLLDPKSARADDACAASAQFLILSMSASGDALNCNVPGTYDLPASFAAGTVNHSNPMDMSMAPTGFTLGPLVARLLAANIARDEPLPDEYAPDRKGVP